MPLNLLVFRKNTKPGRSKLERSLLIVTGICTHYFLPLTYQIFSSLTHKLQEMQKLVAVFAILFVSINTISLCKAEAHQSIKSGSVTRSDYMDVSSPSASRGHKLQFSCSSRCSIIAQKLLVQGHWKFLKKGWKWISRKHILVNTNWTFVDTVQIRNYF